VESKPQLAQPVRFLRLRGDAGDVFVHSTGVFNFADGAFEPPFAVRKLA
jgi:hypothetical protein